MYRARESKPKTKGCVIVSVGDSVPRRGDGEGAGDVVLISNIFGSVDVLIRQRKI